MLKVGMRARVTVQDQEYQGEVTSIANQAEPSNWFSPSVKRYATVIKIDGKSTGLRPGMTAEVEILAANLTGVLTVPEQAVVEDRGEFVSYVANGGTPEERKVELGLSDGTHIQIKNGLRENEPVYQNPRKFNANAHSLASEDERVDVSKRFGTTQVRPVAPAAAVDGRGPGPRGGEMRADSADKPVGPGPEGRQRGPGMRDRAAAGPTAGDAAARGAGAEDRGPRRRGREDAGGRGDSPRGSGTGPRAERSET
jgi:HlyD family secretion protein